MDLLLRRAGEGRSRTPYDAFAVRLRFGGGGAFSEARVRGRLLGQPLGGGRFQLNVLQDYDFMENKAYSFGAQSFEVNSASPASCRRAHAVWVVRLGRHDRARRGGLAAG